MVPGVPGRGRMAAGGSDETIMSDMHGTQQVQAAGAHGPADGHDAGSHDNDHGHPGDTLGPIDWPMWGVGVLGVVLALAVVAGFVLATGFSFGA
jgi:hypothetical protein